MEMLVLVNVPVVNVNLVVLIEVLARPSAVGLEDFIKGVEVVLVGFLHDFPVSDVDQSVVVKINSIQQPFGLGGVS